MIEGIEKADDRTIVLTTKYPFSFLPYMLTRLLIVSPAQWDAVGKTWAEFAKKPSGTGPFKITKVVLGQYAEMSRNEDYWDKTRIPKLDKMVVYPMPESTTRRRRAAVRSGGLDRGAAAGLHSVAEAGRLADQPVAVPAHLSLRAELPGRLAVQGRARTAGAELRDRP